MLLRLRLRRVRAVFLERAGQREFAQPMADHVFGYEHWIENFSIMNVEREADEVRRNHRTTRPGLDRCFRFRVLRLDDFLHQVAVNERTFFNRASHKSLTLFHWPSIAAHDDEPVRVLPLVPRAISFREQTPRRRELLPTTAGL